VFPRLTYSCPDPRIGQGAGFGGAILHGLCTFGFSARAIIETVGGKDPKSLKFFGVRFTAPVKPGDAIETQIWEVGPGPKGTTEVTFVTKNLNTGKVSGSEEAFNEFLADVCVDRARWRDSICCQA
jgi:acyl dehydratase